jgi:hypothetical protein
MEKPESLTLTCCGGKKCPVATLRPCGGVVLRDQDDGKDETIVLNKEQVEKLARFLGWQP